MVKLETLNTILGHKTEDERIRCTQILMNIQDFELQIIKGHLLIEEVLYDLIKLRFEKVKPLEKARLSFAQQLHIVEGLYYSEGIYLDWFSPATNQLNKIRNKLAHKVVPDDFETELIKFSSLVLSNIKKDFDGTIEEKTIHAITNLYSSYSCLLALHKEIKLLPDLHKALPMGQQLTAVKLYNSELYKTT